MKTSLKYRNHSSIIAVKIQCKNRASFSVTEVDKKEVEHLVLNQDMNKLSHSSD